MAKKKNKNKPTIDVEVETSTGPPADPDVPDLPTPKVNVHVTATNLNQNANANVNANNNGNGNGNAAGVGAPDGNKSVHLHHDHAHNHHHSHYARSIDQNSAGDQQVTETKETFDAGGGSAPTVIETTKTKTIVPAGASGNGGSVKVPTVKALSTAGQTIGVPGSPAGSVKSLKSHKSYHQPDIIVNIALPPQVQAAPAPAPAPAPARSLPSASPFISPTAIPLPPSIPPSPTPTIRSLKPAQSMKAPGLVRVTAVPIQEEPGEIEETTVVTTTKTTRKVGTPPKVASPPLAAPIPLRPGTPLVVNDPTFLPLPDSRPPPGSVKSNSHRHGHDHDHDNANNDDMIERTVVETVTYPVQEKKSSFFDKLKLPKFIKPTDTGHTGSPPRKTSPAGDGHIMVHVHGGRNGGVDVDVDTAATTIGGLTTKGGNGARTTALGSIRSEPEGTKAGLRPIPISQSSSSASEMPTCHVTHAEILVDYKALVKQTPPRRRPTLPTEHVHVHMSPTPAAPKTILTMSADLDRDSKGGEHLHARVRDHTNVVKPPKTAAHKTSRDQTTTGGMDVHVDVDGHHIDIGLDEGIETKKEKKEREKRERQERREKEPIYKPLRGAYPTPLSERYAAPPPMEDIQNAARARYERRAYPDATMMGGLMPGAMGAMPGMPGMGGMGMGMPGGGYGMGMGGMPPPMPMTMPAPPAMMGSRPPYMGGAFNPHPVPGMGMPINNTRMPYGQGGMGGYGMGMPAWNGAGYGFMGNPRFPKGM